MRKTARESESFVEGKRSIQSSLASIILRGRNDHDQTNLKRTGERPYDVRHQKKATTVYLPLDRQEEFLTCLNKEKEAFS